MGDKKRWQLIFLVVLFFITVKQLILPILYENVSVPSTLQFFLGRGFGYVLASYFPLYLYKMLEFQSLKWHGKYGALCILVPVIAVFGVVYPIRQNLMEVRICMFILPVSYFLILIYESLRSIIGHYRETRDKHLLKEQLLILMNVAPWVIVPFISIFFNASKQVCDFFLNAPFLISNWFFDKWLDESYSEKENERRRLKSIYFEKEVKGIGNLDIADELKRYMVNLLQKATDTCYEYHDDSFNKTCQLLDFSPAERQVMWQLTLGNMKDKEIGKILNDTSPRTVEKRIEKMRNKADVRSRKELLEKFNIYLNE
ncbi:MAG: hypothetical protein E6Q66_04735 [Pedobacter sp.]|nr:MAG: hypothetical protein E6Q66_04735 [Pedobacter sp.]